jgi:hypothetical protein
LLFVSSPIFWCLWKGSTMTSADNVIRGDNHRKLFPERHNALPSSQQEHRNSPFTFYMQFCSCSLCSEINRIANRCGKEKDGQQHEPSCWYGRETSLRSDLLFSGLTVAIFQQLNKIIPSFSVA